MRHRFLIIMCRLTGGHSLYLSGSVISCVFCPYAEDLHR